MVDRKRPLRNLAPVWLTAIALTILSGCVQPQGGDDGVIASFYSADHWEYYGRSSDREPAMASVAAAARNGVLSVLCGSENYLTILIESPDGTELKETSVKLTFDGTVATDYDWFANSENEEGWAVALFDDEESFWPAINDLKQHRSAEVVISEAGKEWRRFQFTLTGAGDAIDRTVKDCGKGPHS
jgi:hypothetical protein